MYYAVVTFGTKPQQTVFGDLERARVAAARAVGCGSCTDSRVYACETRQLAETANIGAVRAGESIVHTKMLVDEAKTADVPITIDGKPATIAEVEAYAETHGCEPLPDDFQPAELGDSIHVTEKNVTGFIVEIDPCEWCYVIRTASGLVVVGWNEPHTVIDGSQA